MDDKARLAIEHLAGPFTPTGKQHCVRCDFPLDLSSALARELVPVYSDYFEEIGRFAPYEPVWILDGVIWPVSPDPERVKMSFCGSSS